MLIRKLITLLHKTSIVIKTMGRDTPQRKSGLISFCENMMLKNGTTSAYREFYQAAQNPLEDL